jgi:outer membrane protein OmpA-like peptidoglycan-associated protein
VTDVLRSSGQPLDAATRGYMEPRFGHDFSKIPIHPASSAQSFAGGNGAGVLQRKCACGGSSPAFGECEECKTNRGASLQRRSGGKSGPSEAPPIVHEVLRSPGQPLDAATRAFMEPRFGQSFSAVRVHADARAAESAREVNALAYTVGRDVVFAAGQYAAQTTGGKKLLAHELTHVVQQSAMTKGGNLRLDNPYSAEESAAVRASEQILSGEQVRIDPAVADPIVRRQTRPSRVLPQTTAASVCEIHFSKGTVSLADSAAFEQCIQSLQDYLQQNLDATVRLNGYVSEDESGAGDLSSSRAEAVKQRLVQAGISPERITVAGKGPDHSYLLGDLKRRVDVIVNGANAQIETPPQTVKPPADFELNPKKIDFPTKKHDPPKQVAPKKINPPKNSETPAKDSKAPSPKTGQKRKIEAPAGKTKIVADKGDKPALVSKPACTLPRHLGGSAADDCGDSNAPDFASHDKPNVSSWSAIKMAAWAAAHPPTYSPFRSWVSNIACELEMAAVLALAGSPGLAAFSRFVAGTGGKMPLNSTSTLGQMALKTPSFLATVGTVKDDIERQLAEASNGDLNACVLSVQPPATYFGFSDGFALKAVIGGTHGEQLYATAFDADVSTRRYSITLRFVICDNFGVSEDDLYAPGLIPFWILQHERDPASKYKPFVHVLDLSVPISGTF